MKTKRLTALSMLLCAALIIFIVEAHIPPLVPIPGIKLGLANVITLITMYLFSRKEAFLVLVLRIMLSSIFVGNWFAFLYSVAGGVCCYGIMCIGAFFMDEDNLWIVSVLGAIFHNVGQILVACLFSGVWQMVFYLPVLLISAIVTGVFTGFTAKYCLKALKKNKKDINL